MPYIVELFVPPSRVDHLWEHLISPEQVQSLITGHYIIRRNRSERAATHLLTGTDYFGNCLTVAIVRTDDPGVWRVITAWECKRGEATLLYGRR